MNKVVKCDHGIAGVVLGYRHFDGYIGLIVVGDLIFGC